MFVWCIVRGDMNRETFLHEINQAQKDKHHGAFTYKSSIKDCNLRKQRNGCYQKQGSVRVGILLLKGT